MVRDQDGMDTPIFRNNHACRDTVSVGILRGRPFPLAHSAEHICYFRHALALDERRVKFLPEYISGDNGEKVHNGDTLGRLCVKEVWFTGTHSDVCDARHFASGGGNRVNIRLDGRHPSFLWIANEVILSGLEFDASGIDWLWNGGPDAKVPVIESLTWPWWTMLEYLRFPRLTYEDDSFHGTYPMSEEYTLHPSR